MKEILQYSHETNLEIISKFNDGDLHYVIAESSKKLISHILNSQTLWNNKINGGGVIDVWKVWDPEKLKEIEEHNYKIALKILEERELDEIISFSNTKNESHQNSISDIIFHVVNRATYYRGQIAAEFREKKIEPVSGDFVNYKRKA
ncbi:DinB family protein [uncultured Christiangramia sp.]|uniref:DinB family protein n=1 Tax=Christiangramia sp. 3-2217-3z TaxID=3417564 RepID=UPI0026180D45|nr:DinB family protein [uncultured Christiangramia sp.]